MANTMNHSPIKTKRDADGETLFRFRIEYLADENCEPMKWGCWAYSFDHALDLFAEDDEGYEPTRIAKVREDNSTQVWQKV